MKNKFVFFIYVITFLFLCNTILAQSFNGGFCGGLCASEVSGDNLSGPKKLGLNAGIFSRFDINNNAAMQLGLMYIQKGSKKNPSDRNGFTSYRFHLEYVEIPLFYIFSIPKLEHIEYIGKIKYEFGLSYARLMRYKEEDNERLVQAGEKEDYHINETNIIFGFYYPLGEKLDFSFRGSNSLTPIRPHKGKGKVWYNWGQYHTAWTLNLNYKIR